MRRLLLTWYGFCMTYESTHRGTAAKRISGLPMVSNWFVNQA